MRYRLEFDEALYMENNTCCPICLYGEDWTMNDLEFAENVILVTMMCMNCGFELMEVYELSKAIEENKHEQN